MKRFIARAVVVGALVALPASLPAQDHGFYLGAFGGGSGKLTDLTASGASAANFKSGWALGGIAGVDLSQYFGVRASLTYSKADAQGAASFAGIPFRRFYYGAALEVRYPVASAFAPYLYVGGGGATIDQTVADTSQSGGVGVFSKAAGLAGIGFRYGFGESPFGLFAEAQAAMYKWDQGGFNKTQVDVVYVGGLRYRFGF